MPFAVRKCPASNDPRELSFCWKGWNWGEVPPYLWRISSPGALGALSILDPGIVFYPSSFDADHYVAQGSAGNNPIVYGVVRFDLYDTVQLSPTQHTVRITVEAVSANIDIHYATSTKLWPSAIEQWGPLPATVLGGTPNLLPNGFYVTPVKWDTTITP